MPPEASVGIQRPVSFPRFLPSFLFDARDGAADLGGGHVVEQNGFGAVGESFVEFLRGAHLDLHALRRLALRERALEDRRDAAAESDVVVLDENAGGEIDAMIGSAAAEDGVFFEGAQAGDGLARVEDAGVGALDGVSVFARERGDAAEVLEQVENDALATEQDAGIVANDGDDLAGVDADAVEDFGMADDLEAGLRLGAGIEAGIDLKEARDGAEAGDDQLFAGDDGAGGAEIGIDGEMRGGVAGGLVLDEGLLQQCVDAVALPVHNAAISFQPPAFSFQLSA